MTTTTAQHKRTVVFVHPDLGIGGAERLVVDAAVGLQNRGHRVVIFTSHCDPAHCFDEVKPGTGVLDVRVRGGSVVPATVLGRLAILCAIARQAHLLLQVWATGEWAALDVGAVFVDQLSAGLPLLPLLGNAPVLFYCHFPDLLLASGRDRWWKRLYRRPFDALEAWTMGFADAVAVNSQFTRGVVTATWPGLAAQTDLRVVYPCISDADQADTGDHPAEDAAPWGGKPFILSINRFERKKNIGLAVRAFAGLPTGRRAGVRLVVAGGYDARVTENVAYHAELDRLATGLGLRTATARTLVSALGVPADIDVLFLLSVPSALKSLLLRASRLLVYTPAREHFGIVPLEAMQAGVPVLTADTGGPTETVVEGATGWLRSPDDVDAWTRVIASVLPGGSLSADARARMAAAGRARVQAQFRNVQMAARIDSVYDELDAARTASGAPSGAAAVSSTAAVGVVVLLVSGLALLVAMWMAQSVLAAV